MAYSYPTTLPSLLVTSGVTATDYYIVTTAGREIKIEAVTGRAEVQTALTTGTYRDLFQTIADYATGGGNAFVKDQTATPANKSPDDVMHVDPRFLNAVETWVVYTVASGATFGIPKINIVAEGTSPSRIV